MNWFSKKSKKFQVIAIVIFFVSGFVLGFFIKNYFKTLMPIEESTQVRANLPQYKYINPLLFSDGSKSTDPTLVVLESKLNNYISGAEKNLSVSSASVYFRGLNTSQWTGVNENDLYTPSSMIKVVAMMAALKLAEADPSILSEKLHFTRSTGGQAEYQADDNLTDGYYSLQDLISVMIKNSDNDAYDAITADPKIEAEFVQIYDIFRLPPAGLEGEKDYMSPVSYSDIYRVLYNSTFFEWDLSEQVLDLLTQTTFTQGLVAGVPAGTVVAHKFGENTGELHDCGIIYYPNHPYLLCVMTKGSDLTKSEQMIAGISKTVWDFVDSNKNHF